MAKLIKAGKLDPVNETGTEHEQDKLIQEYYKLTRPLEAAQGKHFYFPNEKERHFFLQPHRNRFISGGNRSGKTCTCVMDIVAACEGYHPMQKPNLERLHREATDEWVRKRCEYLLDNKLWVRMPPISARCVTIDFPTYVNEILGPEFVKWATQTELKSVEYDNEKKRSITWKNKSKIHFMTYEQKVKTHGGSALDFVYFDEEPTEGHYQENLMRLVSTNGRIICGMTAVDGVTWTDTKIFTPAEKGDKKFYAIEMSTYENPINTPEIVDEVKSLCISEADVQIRIYGKRVPRGGNIFGKWREAHPFVIERFPIPKEGGMLVMAIDPHPQLPHAVSWIWIDIERKTADRIPIFRDFPNMFICAELFELGGAEMLASYIVIKENELGRKHDMAICDPRGWQKSQEDKNSKSIVEQLKDANICPIQGSKKKDGGLLKMKQCLDLEFEKTLNMQGEIETITREYPQLIMFSDLTHHIFEYKNYRWQPPPMTRSGETKEVAQKAVDKDDHFIENDRRIVEWMKDQPFEIFDTPEYEVENLKFTSNGKQVDINFEEEESMLIGA